MRISQVSLTEHQGSITGRGAPVCTYFLDCNIYWSIGRHDFSLLKLMHSILSFLLFHLFPVSLNLLIFSFLITRHTKCHICSLISISLFIIKYVSLEHCVFYSQNTSFIHRPVHNGATMWTILSDRLLT